jgi:predicted dehydrogenase
MAATAALKATDRDRIRIGFLGGSHSHAEGKISAVRKSADFDVAGIWEPDAEVAAGYEKAGFRLVAKRTILDDPSIRVVGIESDVASHAEHALAAIEAGKHVHVEKPPADNLSAFVKLQEEARKRRLLLQVGYMWRYNPGTSRAIDAAKSGWLGEIYLLRATMNTMLARDRRPEWGKFHGGQMFEQGSHLVDLMVRLMGAPSKVTPFLRKQSQDSLADNTVAILEWPRALGIIHAATLQPNANKHRSFEILGTAGTAVVQPIEPPDLSIELTKADGPYRKGSQQVPLPEYRRYVDDFIELAACIRENKPLSTTPEQDLAIQETLLRACEM